MTNHPHRNRAIAYVHGRNIDFGSTKTYVCVYGAGGNLRHNSDYVIAGNYDDYGTLIYSVLFSGRERFSSSRKAECVAWCEARDVGPGEFFDTSVPGGAWCGWDAGRR